MDLEYDRKFEEMKKYIPFLENMIKRLENTNNGVKNPRKAQLDKIRSLRDLLLDKKKRMKMENLLKCEQVLVNLYAKVEQRDSMADTKKDDVTQTQKEKSDLNIVRNKLKSVVSKLQDDDPETLPEIARATNTEVVCTPGSKEPALFQRRPNKASPLPQTPSKANDENSSNSKRHYTRVLMSPERKKKEWLANSETSKEKPLFSRRSPRRSPRRYSPSYKKERKKSSKQRSKSSQQSKDLNITLKVPEESLGSLNTKDILSRIINCSDNDVDIDTLRGLRSQILGELKQTGTKDDISDLILKSYKQKEKSSKNEDEVEEGELSDSESEAIENIYGSLVVVNQGEGNSNVNKMSTDKKHPRKIQICLVINSDKEKGTKVNDQTLNHNLDITDFETYTGTKTANKATSSESTEDKITKELIKKETNEKDKDLLAEKMESSLKTVQDSHNSAKNDTDKTEKKIQSSFQENISLTESFKPNFYQPVAEEKTNSEESLVKQNSCEPTPEDIDNKKDEVTSEPTEIVQNVQSPDLSVKNQMKKEIVSEIDILQALKKEILSETTSTPMCEAITPPLHQPKITKVASAQETVSKKRISIEKYKLKSVASVKQPLFNSTKQESSSKDENSKKQSLKLTEKECERFNFPADVSPVDSSEDEDKQSWDFEFLQRSKSSDSKNKDDSSIDLGILRGDSAPKSPDHEDFADTGIRPPVIIPNDPVKSVVPSAKADIDMRTLMPLPNIDSLRKSIASPSLSNENMLDATRNEKGNSNESIRKSLPELRMRLESDQASNSPNPYLKDSDRLTRPSTSYPNTPPCISPNISSNIPSLMSLNVAAHMTPTQNPNVISSINPTMPSILNSNIPLILKSNIGLNMASTIVTGLGPNMNSSMTPSRIIPDMNPVMTPILTPNARSYEMNTRPNLDPDDYANQKHVYAPILQANQWETKENTKREDRNCRSTSVQRDVDYHRNRNDRYLGDKRIDSPQIRMECPPTPNPSFGRMECPSTPNPSFGRMECPPTPNPSFGRMECPSTPNPSFGRMECPSTPNPSFGRMECPSTPNPSFGRMECPSTPTPSFGRMECPPTPNPSFGRMDCPPTPNPSFGRMECPPTPNPSFGRMECPLTPNPSFGRMETPMTPIHSFGRLDCPMTPSHSFGRSDSMTPTNVFGRGDYHHHISNFSHKYIKYQDPRLNRSSDYDNCHGRNDERNRSYFEDDLNMVDNTNKYRRSYNKPYEQDSRNGRESMPRREASVGRSLSRDHEAEEFSKDYFSKNYRREKYKCTDDVHSKGNYRARSIGRMSSSEDIFTTHRERGSTRTYNREGSIEKPISVKSHTGRSFNIDTSFNRTFQENVSSPFDKSFDVRRQRASSVGRSLRESPRRDSNRTSINANKLELDIPDRKILQFRRACSVGRDLKDYNANKNFKDVKDDLRSCKFNYDFDLRDRNHKSKLHSKLTNEKLRSNDHNSNRDTSVCNKTVTKYTGNQINRDPRRKVRDYDWNSSKNEDSSKYSPRKNFRDPRMRREIDVKETSKDKYKDRNTSSSRHKNYGIVYSNDNIAKGTILASAAGVKNFKIPKIKRPIEEKALETNKVSESDAKKGVPFKNAKKEDNMIREQNKKVEKKPIRSETNTADKRLHIENINKNLKVDKPKSKDDISSLNKTHKAKSHDEKTDLNNSVTDNCERRITRSAIKVGPQVKEITRTSPMKKLKRIKKPFVYDSDSDSQDKEISKEYSNKNIDENINLNMIKDTEAPINDLAVDKAEVSNKCSSKKDADETEHIESMNSTNENDATINSTNGKNRLDNITEKSMLTPINESREEQNDSLDMSFGVDDELFSDNMASGSVLDNIKALIADLDNDIEAPKINDFNDKFINNIVGNISSNDSPNSLDTTHTDFTSDVTLNEKFGYVVDVRSTINCTNNQITFDNYNTMEVSKSKNISEYENVLTQSEQMSDIQNKTEEIKNNTGKYLAVPITEHKDKPDGLNESSSSTSEVQEVFKNPNTDAIVSTTASDEKFEAIQNKSQCKGNNTIPSIYPFIPDSTINLNENNRSINVKDLQESFPDSTNELASEMNVTSTHNYSDKTSKEQSGDSKSDDNLPRIDSIGKLLSILEDKNKIKELLTMLDKDVGENDKIKKKLEKLSEIVSKDEENSTDVDREGNNKQITDNVAQNENQNEPVVDSKKHDKECVEEKSVIQETVKIDNNEMESHIKDAVNNKVNEINDKYQSTSGNQQATIDVGKDLAVNTFSDDNKQLVNTVKSKNINKDVGKKSLDSNIDEEVKETLKNDNDVNETEQEDCQQNTEVNAKVDEFSDILPIQTKKVVRKSKITKRGRSRLAKNLIRNKDKRITRSEAGGSRPQIPPVPKKPSRELLKLQEDIRDMFISEDILNATGIRMCRLAKLVDEKQSKADTLTTEAEPEPVVVLENIKNKMSPDESIISAGKVNKKKAQKSKTNTNNDILVNTETKETPKYKPGPKSKTKRHDDPYFFETESIGESNNTVDNKDQNTDSDSDSVSNKSFESSELLVELKKKTKRKRRSWQLGVIRKKGGKTKSLGKNIEFSDPAVEEVQTHETKDMNLLKIPDLNCFTDKSYCFHKYVKTYLCRLCGYRGNDIVPHYKKNHPHSEIPLSRLSPRIAKEAIEQCENMNLQAISKLETMKFVCRFCFQDFQKQSTALETFFWHVVSVHTGEYKHLCSECINVTRCPFHLDIPPPPKNLKGQLIGYICGRCNFTQVSLENLKTHVIIRHDDEQTEVYSINLSDIPKKVLQSLLTKASESSIEGIRVLRSTRSNQSITEPSDDYSDITDSTDHIVGLDTGRNNLISKNTLASPVISSKNKIQSKFIFENDDMSDTSSYSRNDESIKAYIKLEKDDDTQDSHHDNAIEEEALNSGLEPEQEIQQPSVDNVENADVQTDPTPSAGVQTEPTPSVGVQTEPTPSAGVRTEPTPSAGVQTELTPCTKVQTMLTPSNDVLDYPHFKIKLTSTGKKEYICCINGIDKHYKTTLLISFKKHVQLKHSEDWDGYCYVCKVIVTCQGKHKFKDCLQHFLDKHIDNFPILEEITEPIVKDVLEPETVTPSKDALIATSYINVRPLSELISAEQSETQEDKNLVPKIQNVVSLGCSDDPANSKLQKDEVYNYEEAQTEVMSKKHRVVLEAMLNPEKLIQVFKCAGRFCSYTTDKAEEALLHASTHQRIGGEGSLKCSYCDFDSSGNAIDLVMHVFKNYNHCSYACSKCFYRAAVGQLVLAHIKRVHSEFDADKVPVLSSALAVKDNTKDDFMSRDAAVLYYVCNNPDPEEGGICKFKSFIMTKFRQHLQARHANDQEYSCYMCNISTPSSKFLALHLKSHGLQIYQCCRCLFGADNELELMAHASEKHPLKQPKAYLRIITSKGDSSEIRVLPLAVLSKSTVETTVVTPSIDNESPVKQAERSIDLEKLIGQTNIMIETMNNSSNAATIEPVDDTVNENLIQLENEQACSSNSEAKSESTSTAVLTLLRDPQNPSINLNTIIKSEPSETENKTSNIPPIAETPAPPEADVVCLDSDDDSSRQNFIDLSAEDNLSELNKTETLNDASNVKIPRSCLYKCSKCLLVCKSEGMLKRHIISCFPNAVELVQCAHCSHFAPANKIVIHYNDNHLENTEPYTCGICKEKFVSLRIARKHLKAIHNETSTVVNSKVLSTGAIQFVLDLNVKERPALKRKLSGETGNKSSESAPKLKKYGPEDVDKLPINPILDDLVYCSLCEFNTKVRLNMVRHLQLHSDQQPVPRTAPVNPVPHLESNEKHFDRMVNLASSSIKTSNKTSKDGSIIMSENLSPVAAAMYPKYVPDKHRYTCGAKGCSYISVNESMFKIHWETLHATTNDYHCVHCPPHQHLDTTKPLTALRIIAHLKMHDIKLYACSSCTFYHFTRKLIEKHLKEVHSGKLIIVREDGATLIPNPTASSFTAAAPTMDLKPWQCGLCKFKSMIRPEVIEHCGKFHQSKMQFKCMYCGFRTSNIENISKHQSKQHPGKKEEVFYFYYQEGSIPNEVDGVARWQKQVQRSESEIKTEIDIPPVLDAPILPKPAAAKPSNVVNLDIVKQEIVEPEANVEIDESIEDLCNAFGQFCDPNGLKYKCSLCKIIIEDTKEAMQSHLYEELQYRKWGCALCSYKAFHKPGLQQHVQTEHRNSREAREPIELQVDGRIEMWVMKLLEHQTTIIEKNKENLAKQKVEILRNTPGTSVKAVDKPMEPPASVGAKSNVSMAQLEKLFGAFGVPNNMNYTCPKCNISARTEAVMQEHLESELNKIRWCCNLCNETFQTYHEAQFHCRSVHSGQSSRPVEATRDVSLRAAWVAGVLHVQKLSMNYMPVTETHAPETQDQPTDSSPENSLLVVRYEEKVPTPEEQMKLNKKIDADDDKLAADETEKKKPTDFECQYCPATYRYESFFQGHVLKHYGLKPFKCPYCLHTDQRRSMESHIKNEHPTRSIVYFNTPIPTEPPVIDYIKSTNSTAKSSAVDADAKIICLGCEEMMTRVESQTHYHDNVRPQFGVKGAVVYRCWTCLTLHKTSTDFNMHHKQFHLNFKKNSSFYKLYDENRSLVCSACSLSFGNITLYRSHHQTKHGLKVNASVEPSSSDVVIALDNEMEVGEKRKAEDSTILPIPKRVARKSTTKLPYSKAVARKSTTKLPFNTPCNDEEYSFYGTRPSMENLENVTTLMPFYNTFVPFTLKKLGEIIQIYPTVNVQDINVTR